MPIDTTTALHVGSGTSNSSTGMLGGWATYGAIAVGSPIAYSVTDWAGLDGGNNIVSLTTAGGSYANDTWSAGSNTNVVDTTSNRLPLFRARDGSQLAVRQPDRH